VRLRPRGAGQCAVRPERADRHALPGDLQPQVLRQAFLGEQERRPRVVQDGRQPPAGDGRVERHIGAARLEHAEDGHDHLRRPLERQRDQALRSDAQAPQVLRQPVCPFVQLAVGEGHVGGNQRRCVGRPPGLRFESGMDGFMR